MLSPDLPAALALLIAGSVTSLLVALRYFVSSGLFAWITARRRPGRYDGRARQIRSEIGWSLSAAVIYGAPAGMVLWAWSHMGWTRLYTDPAAYPLWYLPLSVLIYMAVQDGWFYWTHRAMHASPRLFRIAHAVHHQSRAPTAWTAMSFHVAESAIGALLIPLMVFVVPIHVAMLALVLTIATVMGVTNHMGWEMFPRRLVHSRLGSWLITASHHHKHHEDYQCNFGLYFRFWDHLCGTDKGLSQQLVDDAGGAPRSPGARA